MTLTKEEIKAIRDDLKDIAKNLEQDYKDFEDALKSKKIDFYYSEFYRHGEELITFLTDKKIDELFG